MVAGLGSMFAVPALGLAVIGLDGVVRDSGTSRTRTASTWWTLVTTVGVALLGSVWFFSPSAPLASRPTAGTQVIAFGDSLVEGVGATPGHDFVSLLSERIGVPIINAGRQGDTSASGLARLDGAVLSRSPRVVIVLLGGNDVLRRVPIETTLTNMRTIVGRIREHGAAVVLVGVKVDLFRDSYGAAYKRLARDMSAAAVPNILGGILGRAGRTSDGIHPNDQGYEIIADRLEPLLRDLIE